MIDPEYENISFEDLKEEDKFERYKYISTLGKLILSKKDDSFVLQISGQYGSGKTFFVNLLRKYIEAKGGKTLYYNAWQHDYSQDAFISFCCTFIQHFEISPDSKGFKAATKKLITNNVPAMLNYCIQALIGKYTGINVNKIIDEACNFAKDVDDNSNITKQSCNDALEIELNRKKIIDEFRNELSTLVAKQGTPYPLVVFIDDLDRCKADFTIRLLDYIKHLFNIKGITFILAVDEEQLKSTVQQFYGAQNSAGYLKRIVDFEFKLPLGNYKNYIHALMCKYNFPDYSKSDFFVNLLNNLGFIFDLSLRDFNHMFGCLHKIMNGYPDYDRKPYMYFVAYIMKKHFDKYKHEIELLEIEESKKLTSSQKLVKFFNYKLAHNQYYTNSLLYGGPVDTNSRNDWNLQEFMSRIVEIPNLNCDIPCYGMFPNHLVMINNCDPYLQKTIYERIWEEIDEILKE